MCIAIRVSANNPVPISYLKRSFKRNPHGAGFSVIGPDNTLHIFKGFTTFEDFWAFYEIYRTKAGLIHFRYTTAGETNFENTHPFYFGRKKNWKGTKMISNFCMVHNGTLDKLCLSPTKSDSNLLARDYLSKWIKKYDFNSKQFKNKILRFVGRNQYNKLILMSNKGEFIIINEKFGIWKNGNWYSNRDFQFFCSPIRAYRKFKRKIKNFFGK